MGKHRLITAIHLAGLLWLALCLLYIMALALRFAGVQWWVIFSLSGYSALLVCLLVSLYLFAAYRGVARTQRIELEHPLTTSDYYMFFYVAAPLLGGLTGCFGGIGETKTSEFLLEIAVASLGTAFLVWVIVDPIVGVVEVFTPAGLKHRAERLAQAKAERERKEQYRQLLLADVIQREELTLHSRQEQLAPLAERLAELLNTEAKDFERAEEEAAQMGLKAWQIGGLSCMKQLRDMTIAVYTKKCTGLPINDYLAAWWDGIGNWRNPSFG
jgi:hypothetical protein